MDTDQLEQLIFNSKSGLTFAAAFSSLSEQQRKLLSAHCYQLRQQIRKEKANKDASDLARKEIKKIEKNGHWGANAFKNANLAVFAVCPISTIKKSGDLFFHDRKKSLYKIIEDRKPEWLSEWIAFESEKEFNSLSFPVVRNWINQGLCKTPKSDGYIRLMVDYMLWDNRDSNAQKYLTISERIELDPGVLEDIWAIFHCENSAFTQKEIWFTYQCDKPEVYETWPDLIIKFIEEGKLDRQRVLTALLEGLNSDLKQNQLSGMHKFHEQLKPSKDEIHDREDSYLGLLSSPVGHVVKFALKNTAKLNKAKILNEKIFLNSVSVVFSSEAKGNAVMALKQIMQILKASSSVTNIAIPVIIDALMHPNIDVQSLALSCLKELQEDLKTEDKNIIQEKIDFINASLRTELLALVGEEHSDPTVVIESAIDIDELCQKLATLSEKRINELGLDDIDFNNKLTGTLHPIKESLTIDSPAELEKVQPINDLDSLIQLISSATEEVIDSNDFERILDGVSRLCSQQPDDFAERVAPLIHRLEQGSPNHGSLTHQYYGMRYVLRSVLLSWLKGEKLPLKGEHFHLEHDALEPTVGRLENLQNRVVNKHPYTMFATPTHEGGWIEPKIWVERFKVFLSQNIQLDRLDFCSSMLRLMPVGKAEALQMLPNNTSNLVRVARFLMGEAPQITTKDHKDADLWITAAKTLDPHKDWTDTFSQMKLNIDCRQALKNIDFKTEIKVRIDHGYRFPEIKTTVWHGQDQILARKEPGIMGKLSKKIKLNNEISWKQLPSAALFEQQEKANYWANFINTTWLVEWMFSIWPGNIEAINALALRNVAHRLDMKSSNMEPVFGFYQGLFQTTQVFSALSHRLLTLGLLVSDKDANFAAIDAFIEGLETCKVNQSEVVNALTEFVTGEFVKFNRLTDSLKQISQASPFHAYVVCDVLQNLIACIDVKLRNIFHIFELLYELLIELNVTVSTECIENLSSLKGSSKASKIAKKILSQNNKGTDLRQQVKIMTIEQRLNVLTE